MIPVIRMLGMRDYCEVWQEMKSFTLNRNAEIPDEIWLVQHHPVFTQGQSSKPEHLFNPGEIPVVQTDRGGQVTYHGPGQLVVYPLINLRRKKINTRQFVNALENAIIKLLAELRIVANANPQAPGVYVDNEKIASIGLRVKNGCTYHGLALNVDMDLSPFSRINPCGYRGLRMTQIKDKVNGVDWSSVESKIITHLNQALNDFCTQK